MNLRSRVGLTGGAAVFSALLIASVIIYPSVRANLYGRIDGQLVAEATQAPEVLLALKQKAALNGSRVDLTAPVTVNGTLMQVVPGPVTAGPSVRFASLTARDVAVADGDAQSYLSTVTYQGVKYRLYTAALRPASYVWPGIPQQQATSAKQRAALVTRISVRARQAILAKQATRAKGAAGQAELVRTAIPLSAPASTLNGLEFLFIVLTVGGSVVAALLARLTAGRVLRPVRRLTDTVEHVTRTRDLTARIQTDGRDEVGRLGRSFTAMMAALEDSVNAQRRLVADASHELRTPLTSLTTNLELLGEKHGLEDPDAPAMVREALDQTSELRRLVNDLVDLARYGEAEPHVEDIRLDLLTEQVVRRAAARSTEPRFESELTESLVTGDPAALARAIGNLVDNAVKWSPPGGRILVTVGTGVVTVTDEGPGVPVADLPYIFDRFYRSPAARSLPGSGLGLAIVAKVAQTHGGVVTVEPDGTAGARFLLSLPEAGDGPVSPRRRG